MSKYRRAAKRDACEPEIVEALQKAGWEVHRDLPIDLLCLKREGRLIRIRLLECKVKGKKPRKDQAEQNAFCERWNIPKPVDAFTALLAVGEVVDL